MAKITRAFQKIFGGSLAAANNIAKFGSLKSGSPAYSLDPAEIQTAAWLQAWGGALVNAPGGNASPALQDMNAFMYLVTRQLAYLMQDGIPEWNTETVYYTDSYCKYNGVVYISKTDDNLNHLPTDTNNWKTLASTLLGTQDGVCKAWVCFDGTTGAIWSAFNVASITRTATGCYIINFNTALANNGYAFAGSAGTPNGYIPAVGDNNLICGGVEGRSVVRTTTQLSVFCVQGSTGALEDSRCISVQVFGNSNPVGNVINGPGGGGGGGGEGGGGPFIPDLP